MPGADVNAPRVIVTRAASEAGDWVRKLQQAGFHAEAFPLIDIAPTAADADRQALEQAWKSLHSYAACLFVSGNAVSYFFKHNKPVAHIKRAQIAINNVATRRDKLPPELRFMAPGPGTAAALLAAGVPAGQIDGPALDARQFDSQALWQAVGARDWQGRRVLIVRGHSRAPQGDASQGHDTGDSAAAPGRDWIARQWALVGAQVDFVSVYQRRAPQLSQAQLQRAEAASTDGSVWLFSSSEAVANLVASSAIDFKRALALATHPRIAEAARAAGWGVVVESRPALHDIEQALRSIELGHP